MARRVRFDAVSPEEHDGAELFLEELMAGSSDPVEARSRPSTTGPRRTRPTETPTPTPTTITTAPTMTIPSPSITSRNFTDAGTYSTDPDPMIARLQLTGQRVHETKMWLLSHRPERPGPPLVASRESTGERSAAQYYDRLVRGLVTGGFPVSMWGALIATSELSGSTRTGSIPTQPFAFSGQALSRDLLEGNRRFSAVRQRLAAPGIRTWLERAARIAEIAWKDSSRSKLTTSLQQITRAATATTPQGTAVSACAMLAHASHRLLAAFPSSSDHARAAPLAARLDYESRAAFVFLLASGSPGIDALRAAIQGQAAAIPEPLRSQAASVSARVRALRQHFKTELPAPYTFLSQW